MGFADLIKEAGFGAEYAHMRGTLAGLAIQLTDSDTTYCVYTSVSAIHNFEQIDCLGMEVLAKYFDDKKILRILFGTHPNIPQKTREPDYRGWVIRLKEEGQTPPFRDKKISVKHVYS